jgi:hypothetical protein
MFQSIITCKWRQISLGITCILLFHLIIFTTGCGLNPIQAPNIISGSDSLYAATNENAVFVFTGNGQDYGSFQLNAYVTFAYMTTPQGGGIQKRSENLTSAPESGYTASENCGYYYYYLITDVAPHYAKLSIRAITQDEDGITVEFSWWLQTEAGDRNF